MNRHGETRVIAWHNAILRDKNGKIKGILCSGQDITDIQQYEKKLHFAELSVEHAPYSVLWINPDGSLFNVNITACNCLGYSKEELLNLKLHDINPVVE